MRRFLPVVLLALLLAPAPIAEAADPKVPVIAIDPGHDANDWGTTGVTGGRRLIEKDLTLAVARQTSDILQRVGYRTVLTRTDDAPPSGGVDRTGDGKIDLADALQARIDRANDAGASVLVSIHFNGSTDATLRGPEAYYSASRPFAGESRKLADAVMAATTARMGDAGRPVTPRGVLRDTVLGGGSLYLLGPKGGRIARPSAMPGILIEGLFLTNAGDAALLGDAATLQTLARGYADGIAAYLGPPPKPMPKRGVVIGFNGAFLRPSPLLGTDPIATLLTGATVDIAEAARGDDGGGSSDWWRVDFKGQAGYIFAPLLQTTGAVAPVVGPAAAPTQPAPRRVTVRNDDGRAARLRSRPTRDGEIVDRARPGETLEVLDQTDGESVDGKTKTWLKVRHGDVTGWVWAALVDG